MTDAASDSLPQALSKYSLELPSEQIEQLDRYCRLLWDWNMKLNLTRHTDYDKFVARDLLDSLELAKLLAPREEILDVGSGGGVPGIVLAIVRPDLQMSLSESIGKKARALTQIIGALNLSVAVHACRAEEVLEALRFDTLVARAVGPLPKMLGWLAPYWLSIGRLLVVKGPRWSDEKAEAEQQGELRQLALRLVAEYPMPGTNSHSVILELTRRA